MVSYLLSVRQSVRVFFLFLYLGCIVALSLLPPQDLPRLRMFPGFDKLVHFGMYFVFSVIACWSLKVEKAYSRLILIVLVTVGWGVLMEFLQRSMNMGRSFSWFDALANSFGVLFGILFYVLVSRYKLVLRNQ